MSSIFQSLQSFDQSLFVYINQVATHPLTDTLMPFFRESTLWIPFYLFLIVFVFVNFGKKGWVWLLFAFITVLLTDQFSSSIIKNWVQRPRPCADPLLYGQVRLLLDHCSGGYSFTSSHATNHFGVATFLFVTLGRYFGNWKYLLFIWAALICYAQVYVGVHYPLDVVFGALLGFLIGHFVCWAYQKSDPLHISA
ncbi:MAG: phosphatase PAP2 family protein [Bacteroidota bacterium]|jgi:membrane-associated phospholipid phosphatase